MGRDDSSQDDACEISEESSTADERAGVDERAASDERAHLAGVDAGCGCVEVWEHLSEQRAAEVAAEGGATRDGCATRDAGASVVSAAED